MCVIIISENRASARKTIFGEGDNRMKYSSYGIVRTNVMPISFTLYDGKNRIYRPAHESRGRILPFSILLYTHDSVCRIVTENGEYTAEPGEAFIFPHNVRHDFFMSDSGNITWTHIFLTASGIPLSDIYRIPTVWNGADAEELLECMSAINRCFGREDTGVYSSLADSIGTQRRVLDICGLIVRTAAPISDLIPMGADSGFFRVLSYISAHPEEQYTSARLSDISGMPEQLMRKVFKKNLGLTPTDYVIKRKLLTAAQLFTHGGLSIGAAAEAVGYDDQMYFSRQFRKHMGCSPTEYRASVGLLPDS
mgnify:FL=1